jgi:tight adherence protein B
VYIIALLAFLAVFALAALILGAARSDSSKEFQKTLDAALKGSVATQFADLVDIRKSTVLSGIPWLNRWLADAQQALKLRQFLDQADLQWTPSRAVLTVATSWAVPAYLIYLRTGIASVSLLLALPAGILPVFYIFQKRRKRLDLFLKKLPDTLDLMVSAMRAGYSMVAAFGHAASEAPEPIGREFRLCFEEQNFGVDLRVAAYNLVRRVPLQELRIVTTAMIINKESGGNLAEVLEKTSLIIRERTRIRQQIRVHTAQGRLTGQILSVLPVALGVLLYIINPDYMGLLIAKPLGQKMMVAAGIMNVLGMLIIRKIVNIQV